MTCRYIMSCVFALAILFGSIQHAHGQLNQGGTPFSFDFDNKNLNTVEFVQMEQVDLEALRAEDRVNDFELATPFRFGKNLEVNLNPSNSGVWDEVKEGYNIWRLGITSPGARSINLMFDEYELPEGATLYIYNKKRTDIIGAFTHHNNQEDGMFATTLVAGDEIIIEYLEPAGVEFEARLNLARVTHGYRALGSSEKFGGSGSCNLNVACEEADGWEEQISSAALMLVDGNAHCSGQLINNTNNDGRPYFLSADHCFRNPEVNELVFLFNYESETCSNPSTPPSHDALSGAVTVSRNSASDFWLMELNDEIPAEYNLFFSGWNRTEEPEIPGYIFGVHHPSGDIKKFSYLFDGVTASSYLGATGSGTTHWRVGTWADATTTEPGSSGSALFDGDGRIIGQLHGGYAACGNTLEDWYGRIGTSWEGGGTPATRLKDWLDPGNTGAEVWDGYNPNLGAAIVQLVHNSADPALDFVDIYINGELAIGGFEFRTSLSGVDLPSGHEISLGIAAKGSSDIVMSTQYTFGKNENYLIILDGVETPEDFAPNPGGIDINTAIRIYNDVFDIQSEVDVNAFYFSHGSTDLPQITVKVGNHPRSPLAAFGVLLKEHPDLESDLNLIYIALPGAQTPLFILEADLSMVDGEVIGLYASGFLDSAENKNGAELKFFAVRENGEMISLRDVPLSNEHETNVPAAFALEQNYPNPFNPTTSIEYALPEQTQVRLEVYNLMGQRVATLVNGTESAGRHTVSFDASRLSSGMYVYRLEAGSYVETRKMMLVK